MQSRPFLYVFYMNACWASHLEMSPKHTTMTNIVLFLASEQTHSALVVCDSEWVTACSFTVPQRVRKSSEVVTALFGWCHVKLLPSRRTFCVDHATMHRFTVSLYSKPHTHGACVFISNPPPLFWQNDLDRDLLRATAITRGRNGYPPPPPKKKSWQRRKKFSIRSC